MRGWMKIEKSEERVKQKTNIATIADIIVLVAVTLLNPMMFPAKLPPIIPDKVVRYYEPQLSSDSIRNAISLTEKEISQVPVKRNCITICRGNLFDGTSSAHSIFITISVDADWDENINVTF